LGLCDLETGYVAKVFGGVCYLHLQGKNKSNENSQVRYSYFIFTLIPSPRMENIFFSKTSVTKSSSTPYEHLKIGLTLRVKPNK
jgi:hypothetical protein